MTRENFSSGFDTLLNSYATKAGFGNTDNPLFSWDGTFIANTFRKRGLTVKAATQEVIEKRRITPDDIEKWFNPDSAYGAKMCEAVGTSDLQKIVNLLLAACSKTVFNWKSEITFLRISVADDN